MEGWFKSKTETDVNEEGGGTRYGDGWGDCRKYFEES